MIEGVIQFQAHHSYRPLSERRFGDALSSLFAWREVFCALRVVGQEVGRYDDAGFGNLSSRVGPYPGRRGARPFLITGTQTSGEACVSLADCAYVHSYDIARNEVISEGERLPSSESMTHGALYDVSPAIRCVIHIHAPVIFELAGALRLPTTSPSVGYGTPEMAHAVAHLWRSTQLERLGVLVMGGHEDGVVGFGASATEAGHRLLEVLVQALTARQQSSGVLCHGEIIRKELSTTALSAYNGRPYTRS